MVRSTLRLVFHLFLLLVSTSQSKALEISFNRISNGLSTNFVNCVSQSADGFIWVGTQNGLQRYDGYRFRRISTRSGKGIPSLPVDQIFPADDSAVLIVRMGHRIGLLDTRTFIFSESAINSTVSELEENNVKLFKDGKDTYLIIFGKEILTYNRRKNCFEKNVNILNYPDGWKPTGIQRDKSGKIWVSGYAGIGYFDPLKKVFYTPNNNPTKMSTLSALKSVKDVTHFMIDSHDRFFINTWPLDKPYTILLFDPGTPLSGLRKISTMPNPKSNYNELSGFSEQNGLIWGFGIDTFNLFEEKTKSFEIFFNPDNLDYGIKVNNITQIFRDRDKNLWVATDNGLYTMSIIGDHIRNAVTTADFGTAPLSDITALSDGRLILSSWGSKISVYRYDSSLHLALEKSLINAIYKNTPKGDNFFSFVWAVEQEISTGKLYLACQAGRLIEFDFKKNASVFLTPSAFKGQTIRTLANDNYGKMWFGTHGGLLIQRNESDFTLVANLKSSITRILSRSLGSIWVATAGNGIFELDVISGKVRSHLISKKDGSGLTTNRVSDIAFLGDSTLAIACSSGLDFFNLATHKIKQFNTQNGLPQGVVTSLVPDGNGHLWMATIGGICRYNSTTGEFQIFDKKAGFLNTSNMENLMNQGLKLPDGKIAFSGESSFVIFDPVKLNITPPVRKVTITDFKLFDHYLSMDSIGKQGRIKLKHDENFINISFAPLTYGGGNELKYFYKLEGASEKWIRSETGLSATFASLQPGEYNFMVRSQNTEGKFSDITSLGISISPAFYQSWWFVVILILIALFSIYTLYQARLKRLLEVHRLREKVARDLHDDVGSTLTSINILSEVARQGLEEDSMAKQYLQRIGKNSTQMMESMDDIVWSIKPDNDQLHKITARMREYTASILEPQNIRYSFEANDNIKHIKLGMESRRNLFLIFKEALNNISKYSEATLVGISIRYEGVQITLSIFDNGKGFDLKSHSRGNGLMNMRKRSDMLKGSIDIQSAPGEGTRIVLKVSV